MSDTLPFSDDKSHLSELADRVERDHERILVTRNGRPSFVLISPDDLQSLEETLDILRDPELVASIARSRRESATGDRARLRDHLSADACPTSRSRRRDCDILTRSLRRSATRPSP